jgi:hypothetical protein
MYRFFDVDTLSKLDIDSHSNVIVKPPKNNKYIEVEISGGPDDDVEAVTVEQIGTTFYIKDKSPSNSNDITITSNNSVMNFRGGTVSNVSIGDGGINFIGNVSGTVTINSKTVNLDDFKDANQKDVKPIVITIYTPSICLDLKLSGSATFTGTQSFYSANVDTCHDSIVNLAATDLMVNSSNSSCITANLLGGDVMINSSNSSEVSINGDYKSIMVNSSNSSNVTTKGHCLGNYIASASNSSYICNDAKVDGRKTQNTSNSAKIRL